MARHQDRRIVTVLDPRMQLAHAMLSHTIEQALQRERERVASQAAHDDADPYADPDAWGDMPYLDAGAHL